MHQTCSLSTIKELGQPDRPPVTFTHQKEISTYTVFRVALEYLSINFNTISDGNVSFSVV